jgi:hypothetical protein
MFSCRGTSGHGARSPICRMIVCHAHRPRFRSPRDPYTDGRIIAGQPTSRQLQPAGPVAGSPTPRVFTNEDLEARRNMRERIVNVGRNSGTQDPSSEMERMRQERGRLNTGVASGFAKGAPGTTAPGVRTVPSTSAPGQTAPTRLRDNWSNEGSTVRSEQRQRIYRVDAPNTSEPSAQRQSPSTWAGPAPVPHPSVDPAVGVRRTQTTVSDRQRVYEVYRDNGLRQNRSLLVQPVQRRHRHSIHSHITITSSGHKSPS